LYAGEFNDSEYNGNGKNKYINYGLLLVHLFYYKTYYLYLKAIFSIVKELNMRESLKMANTKDKVRIILKNFYWSFFSIIKQIIICILKARYLILTELDMRESSKTASTTDKVRIIIYGFLLVFLFYY